MTNATAGYDPATAAPVAGSGSGSSKTTVGAPLAPAPAAAAAPRGATKYSAADLIRFTAKHSKVLGAGSFGVVYDGALPDGRRVAVKQLELAKKAGKKKKKSKEEGTSRLPGDRLDPYSGEAGFQLELHVLEQYVHPHLVELIGYCVDKQRKGTTCSLVLEFMAGGALMDRLAPWSDAPPTAQERFGIAADVAKALHYLHAEASPPLIHQDVKSDNILLAEIGGRLVAKVADFGTARMAPQLAMSTTARAPGGRGGQTHHSTGIIVGTRPYMPMEVISRPGRARLLAAARRDH